MFIISILFKMINNKLSIF